jgi:hypothetical protein
VRSGAFRVQYNYVRGEKREREREREALEVYLLFEYCCCFTKGDVGGLGGLGEVDFFINISTVLQQLDAFLKKIAYDTRHWMNLSR